jgi:hypothetical protein
LGAYEAFYIHAILFNTRSAVVSIEWVSIALEQISRDLSGDALAQVVGAGLVALRTTGQQPARYSRRLASVMKSSRSLTKFSEVHDRLLLV